ncbi:hypothetical protein E4Z61_02360 [Citrobacter tructae]|uniref:Uncharacterized protein n=1 Tax=Citrobacter tructae TaxID=2562449 RepID=A0ABX5T179_9ENTR|nr:hypothetical protein E4Z61_02360 [Citrobacter tructae]
MVPGTASIYGLCFSAGRIIPLLNETVCDRFLRIFRTLKITVTHYLSCGLRVDSPAKLRINKA